ncbi:MAG TPA: glycosyltransferase family 9 protein [Bryobacteraceae bacterium]|nr:glycosyltransferase family 9 protein [Bryobacteraceae bacterium]
MASTSASELLGHILADGTWPPELLDRVIARAAADPQASREFFTVVIERLGDLFEPGLCDAYARLFSRAIEYVDPELRAADLTTRYDRVRRARPCRADPGNVFVLSRITLGADVVVTSTILDAVMRRWPRAKVWFVGPRKNWALFAGNPRVERLAFDYPRGGTLSERIAVWRELRNLFEPSAGIVIDPDSRLTQLGLLPICREDRYFLFESRAYGGAGDAPLAELTRQWCGEVFGIDNASRWVAPLGPRGDCDITISFGVGENEEKRVGDEFERELLVRLATRRITLDAGATGTEAARAKRAAEGLEHVTVYQGEYAPFAAMITGSRLYVGYDSAGQHVAAAAGTPLVSIFTGYASERMLERWKPTGAGFIHVVDVAAADARASALSRVLSALQGSAAVM